VKNFCFKTGPRSAYLHIPFCHRRCFYCDFVVVPIGDNPKNGTDFKIAEAINTYLDLIHREISLVKETFPLSTIYIGGGTPSLLSASQVEALINHLRDHFGIQPGAEITLEVDPASFYYSDLIGFIQAGVNRISLGVQSFDDQVLKKIGRTHKYVDIIQACEWIKTAYDDQKLISWSLDLIQGLPGENIAYWQKQLEIASLINSPHLSVYELTVEPGTVFDLRNKRGLLNLPSDKESYEMNRITSTYLSQIGYSRYEISSYALPNHLSRHNRVYWGGAGWWGFGLGATSSPWGKRFTRPNSINDYAKWIDIQARECLHYSLLSSASSPMDLDESIMVGLRKREGIDLEMLSIEWGWDYKQRRIFIPLLLKRWKLAIDKGWIIHAGNRFRLSNPDGMDFSNQVLIEMFVWWESLPENAALPSSY